MGQNQSQKKSRNNSRAPSSRSKSATTGSDSGTPVDPVRSRKLDDSISNLLQDAPGQVDTLAALTTVPCVSGDKLVTSDDVDNNNSIPPAYDKDKTEVKDNVTVAEDAKKPAKDDRNQSVAKDDGNQSAAKDAGNKSAAKDVGNQSISAPETDSNAEVPLKEEAIERSEDVTEERHGLDDVAKNAKLVAECRKKRPDLRVKVVEAYETDKDAEYIPNIKPNITMHTQRKKGRFKRTQKLESVATSNQRDDRVSAEQSHMRKKKVDTKIVEEKVKAARAVFDSETTMYVEELFELNATSTQITEDNRVMYVIEDEDDDDDKSQAHARPIYSNVIFFPDRSKGATPKRYGPKRLGSIHPTTTDSEHSTTDSDESLISTNSLKDSMNDVSTVKSVMLEKDCDMVQPKKLQLNNDNKSTEGTPDKCNETVVDNKDVTISIDAKNENEKLDVENGLKTEINKSNGDESLRLEVQEDIKEENLVYYSNSCVLNCNKDPRADERKTDSGDFEVLGKPENTDQCTNSLNQQTSIEFDCCNIGRMEEPVKAVCTVTEAAATDTDRDKHSRSIEPAMVAEENISVEKGYSQKMNTQTHKVLPNVDTKLRNRKVNICQTPVHVSYKVPVRTVVDDLQSNMAPDIDWSKLRSRQARFASQLKSSKTKPGEDNRMALEFHLPSSPGSLEEIGTGARGNRKRRDFSRRLSSGSESDFNTVENEFDSDDDSDELKIENKLDIDSDSDSHQNQGEMICSAAESDYYSEELAEKYGLVVSCLRRRNTDIEDDNRIVFEDNQAVCVEFDDEDDGSSIDSDISDVSSIKSSSTDTHSNSILQFGAGSDSDKSDSPIETSPRGFDFFRDYHRQLQSLFEEEDTSPFLSMLRRGIPGLETHNSEDRDNSQRDAAAAAAAAARDHGPRGLGKFPWIRKPRENREEIHEMVCRAATGKRGPRPVTRQKDVVEDGPEIELAEDTDSSDDRSTEDTARESRRGRDTAIECLDLVEPEGTEEDGDSDGDSAGTLDDLVIAEEDIWDDVIESELKKAVWCDSDLPTDSRCTLLCLDISASMAGKPWQELGSALTDFVTALEDVRRNKDVQENVGVVIFGHETRVALPLTTDYQLIPQLFSKLSPGGCSPLAVGLTMCVYPRAVQDIGKCSLTLHGIPVSTRVIVFSDGHPTPVDIIQGRDRLSKELHERAMENIQEIVEDDFKIQIDCVGLSDNVNMGFLESLSALTGGRTVPASEVGDLAYNTYNHYIAAHVGGPMFEARGNELDLKVFEKLVWTIYPSVTTKQMTEVTDIIKKECERRTGSSADGDSSDENHLDADMSLEKEGLLPLGTRVVKGPDYDSESAEMGGNLGKFEKGVIISHRCSNQGHVLVQWDNGVKVALRCGQDNAYDVMPDESKEAPDCKVDDPIKVGLNVRRGPDWQFGNQDGGSDNLGTVYGLRSNGEVLVRWSNGNVGNYRYSASNTYDVLISDPKDPFGRDFYTTEMNRRNQIS